MDKKPIVNSADMERLFSMDPIFIGIHEKFGSPPNWTRPQGFETLCKIILEQQVSLASANAHFEKLKSRLSSFTPEEIVSKSVENLREAQISRQKSSYLIGLSEAVLSGKLLLEELPNLEEIEIRERLTSIKGIGKWSSDIYLLFCLQSKDVMPLGDIAVIKTIKELKDVEYEKIEEISNTWSPLRSLATFFLWHYYLRKRKRSAEDYI